MIKRILEQIWDLITELKRISTGYCPICGNKLYLNSFKDSLSIKECRISGLCQNCQDKIFGV